MNARDYIERHFNRVDGWLWEQAVYATELLIVSQRDMGVDGISLEIGVWKGKYLGVIIGISPDRDAYGIDVWIHNQADEVARFLKEVSPSTTIVLRRANTFNLDIDSFRAAIDDKLIAYASVDGSHEPKPVERDLLNVSQLLCPGGIIAIDDFLNPLTLGVTEGVLAFLKRDRPIEPICWIANKLFVTTSGWSELYQIRLRMWVEEGAVRALLGKETVNWGHQTTHLLGRPVLIL
jgi:hypothetical protein